MSEHKYRLRYTITVEEGEFTKEDVSDKGVQGLADAFIFTSILFPEDGSRSDLVVTRSGVHEGGDLPDTEIFKSWSLMARRIAHMTNIQEWQRQIAALAFETVRKVIVAGTENEAT